MIDLQALIARGCRSQSRVGIGLSGDQLEGVRQRLSSCGCAAGLEGFADAHSLVRSLSSGELDAAIRGSLRSSDVLPELKAAFGVGELMRAAVLDPGSPFVLAPVGVDEGMDASSRLRIAEHAIRYFASIGWALRIGVLSKGRSEDGPRGSDIERSLREGEMIATSLSGKGHNARHHTILLEDAFRDCDLILAPDGVSGNLIFRTLHFVGGARAYGAPVVNLDRVFVDTSRANEDFSGSVMLAAGLAERRRALSERA